ncbi:MAG TPA: recombinase family protein [Steroidobacteraceae bacterium]|nr:recombinase family protein [Steroidobacteraceae bacterium]
MSTQLRAALYARYSTATQSKDSVTDQLRVCERLAEREGFQVVARFSDAAISGGTARRAGYAALLAAARREEFEIILAEDSSRLWRNLAEQAPRLAELADIGVAVVTHDLDTRSESAGMLGAVLGASAEAYRREIGRRTRRGLEGRAAQGAATGGRAYGYEPVLSASGAKGRRIVPERAAHVRWIFEQYAAGWSPRRIASELNARGIPSPGADWRRQNRRRDGKWLDSTINNGILDNPIYAGELVWNRVKWVRSAADSKRRRPVANPESEWIRRRCEELRIVPQELWERVRARRAARAAATAPIRCRPKAGRRPFNSRAGRRAKYPLSGLLRCATCGASYAMADGRYYACASNLNGGAAACSNARRVKRVILEERVIGSLRDALLTPGRIERFRRGMARGGALQERALAAAAAEREHRLARAERAVANLLTAIKAGILTPSTRAELLAAEAEREAARREPPPQVPTLRFLPDAVARYKRLVEDLPATLGRDPDRAREILRGLLGEVRLVPEKTGLFAEISMSPGRLLALAGCDGSGGRI